MTSGACWPTCRAATRCVVRDRVKFRVGQIVYVAFSQDETEIGFGFPKEERAALVAERPDVFFLPRPSDLRFNWIEARLDGFDPDEMRELVLEAWRMVRAQAASRPRTSADDLGARDGHRYAPAMTDDLTLVDLTGDDLADLPRAPGEVLRRRHAPPGWRADRGGPRAKSRRSMAELFPDGQPAEGNQLWRAKDADGADGRHPLAGPARRRGRRPLRLDLRHRGGGVPARAGLGSAADAGRRADQPRVGADLVAAQRLRRQRGRPQPVPQPGLPRAGGRRWRRISERVGVRHDSGRAGGRAGGPGACRLVRRPARPRPRGRRPAARRQTDAPDALDHVERSGGWWAVVADYEGAVVAARFADVSRTEPPAGRALGRVCDVAAWSSSLSETEYVDACREVRSRIARGEVYQVNVCRVLEQDAARGRRRGRAGPPAA